MKESRSSVWLFITYKYVLYVFVFFPILILIDEANSRQYVLQYIFASVVSFFLCFLFTRNVFMAKVSKKGIELTHKSIEWNDIRSITRVHQLYFARLKKGGFFFFPISKVPYKIFGESVSDTDMEQTIQKMMSKE